MTEKVHPIIRYRLYFRDSKDQSFDWFQDSPEEGFPYSDCIDSFSASELFDRLEFYVGQDELESNLSEYKIVPFVSNLEDL